MDKNTVCRRKEETPHIPQNSWEKIIWWPLTGFLQAQHHPSRAAPCSQQRAPNPACGSQAPTCSFEALADTLTSILASYLSWKAKLLSEGWRKRGRGGKEKGGSRREGRLGEDFKFYFENHFGEKDSEERADETQCPAHAKQESHY